MSDIADVLERIDDLVATQKCPHCDRDFHRTPVTQAIDRMFKNGWFESNYFQGADTSPVLCDGSEFIGPLRPEPMPMVSSGWMISGFDTSGWIGQINDMAKQFAKFTFTPSEHYQWPQFHFTTQKWILGANQSVTFYDNASNTVWTNKPKPCEEPAHTDLPDITVEFGPQNWHYEFQRPWPSKSAPFTFPLPTSTHWSWSPTPHLAKQVVDHWKDFTAIPTPQPRAYDFSALTPNELTNTGPQKAPITKGRKK